jgi:hypothetical protein
MNARRLWAVGFGLWVLGFVLVSVFHAHAQDMPEPSAIHGRAIPAGELPDGTVTVRVVREAIGNNIAGQSVRVTAPGKTFSATTDELGRAEFKDLPRGAEARAEAAVDGESLVSQPFAVPAKGGLRVILVSGIAAAAARKEDAAAKALAEPPVRGTVVFGGETRIIAEFQGDTLVFFYQLDIVNTARTRVDIGGPIILDLPTGAAGATTLTGSPKSATISGARLTVAGPFDPGTTKVEVRFQLPHHRPDITVAQAFPVAVQQWLVGIERVGGVTVSSPQFRGTEQRATENGSVFVVGTGPALAAGSSLTLQFANLPTESRIAARTAIGIAVGLMAFGAWLSLRRRPDDEQARAALLKRRDALLSKLADLEKARRSGVLADDRYLSRRQRLISDLEHIYGEIDDAGNDSRDGERVPAT